VIFPVGEEFGIIDEHVMEFCDVERIVRLEGVCLNKTVWSDSVFDDQEQIFWFLSY
jgi:hypothetical protein